jgi:hypothetical protein
VSRIGIGQARTVPICQSYPSSPAVSSRISGAFIADDPDTLLAGPPAFFVDEKTRSAVRP